MVSVRRRAAVAATALCVVVGGLNAGCDDYDHSYPLPADGECPVQLSALTLVYGARSNSPQPSLPPYVAQLLKADVAATQPVSVVGVEGRPHVILEANWTQDARNAPAKDEEFQNRWDGLNEALANVKATTAEADLLAALSLAGRTTPAGGTIVVLDSGLQTTAPLDFAQSGMLDAEPADIVAALQEKNFLPQLDDRHVIMAGIGDTAAPQETLIEPQRRTVVAIWKAIATAAHAKCVSMLPYPINTPAIADLPPVKLVRVASPTTFVECGETVFYNGREVGFEGNSDVFRDPDRARAALRPVASSVLAKKQRVELVGTTARAGTRDGQKAVGQRRADAVKRELVAMGVPESWITTSGVGSYSGHYEPDGGPGTLIAAPAARNRSVIMTLHCPRS